ncbi:hypothetical protein MTO96_002497 [Rhipicephalus appendiculatus]
MSRLRASRSELREPLPFLREECPPSLSGALGCNRNGAQLSFARDYATTCQVTGRGGGGSRNGDGHCKNADIWRAVGAGMPSRRGSAAESPSRKPVSEA